MVSLHCCGNQPTPIVVGLLITFLTCLTDCYPSSSSDNLNSGQVVYRPKFNQHSSKSSSPSTTSPSPSLSVSSKSPSADLSSSSSQIPSVPLSTSSSSSPVASQQSILQQLPQPSYHHSSSLPGITFVRGPSLADDEGANKINHRPNYQDYLDTFRLPLMPTNIIERPSSNNIGLFIPTGLSTSGKSIKSPKFILSQSPPPPPPPPSSPIDFDYVPYSQSDFNPLPSQSSYGSERSGSSDLYEDDYTDPIYDLKYDPVDDSNWLNEPALSSYRQQQQQQQQPALPPLSLIPPPLSYSSYSPYPLPSSSSSGNSGSSSEELLTNLMFDYIVKEMEKNSQQQSISQSSEPVQHLIRLQHHHHPQQQQQQQQQPIDELRKYESYMEKKSSSSELSSLSRDKGLSISSGDKNNSNNNKKETESMKRIEQRGQKEYPMLRPSTENNGKDDIDNQPSLTSQLQSLSSSSSSVSSTSSHNQPAEKSDEEVDQLKSLLQSA